MKLFINAIQGSFYETRAGIVMPSSSYEEILNVAKIKRLSQQLKANKIKEIPNGSAVYFSKSVTFSRTQFREWAKKHDCRIVRNPEKADVIVYDNTAFKEVIKNRRKVKLAVGIKPYGGIGLVDLSDKIERDVYLERWAIWRREADVKKKLEQICDLAELNKQMINLKELTEQVLNLPLDEENLEIIEKMLTSGNDKDISLGIQLLSQVSLAKYPRQFILLCMTYENLLWGHQMTNRVEGVQIKQVLSAIRETSFDYAVKNNPEQRHLKFIAYMERLGFGSHITIEEWRKVIAQIIGGGKKHLGQIPLEVVGLDVQIGLDNAIQVHCNLLHSGSRAKQ